MDILQMEDYHVELRSRLREVEAGRAARVGELREMPTIPELFQGKAVLITGATGFLGKVLLEKLLRSCPGVDTVYLLLRPKRGVQPKRRIEELAQLQLFDQLRRARPDFLDAVVAVTGDCSEPGLGLSPEDREMLQERVSFVFHSAASVRFDDPIKKAVLLNTRGAKEVVDLCRGMKRLEALVHISTAFTNINRDPIGECVYSSHLDWRLVTQAVEKSDHPEHLDYLGPLLRGFHPNTYTFSKALAEEVAKDAGDDIPVIIVRPAVVVGAAQEPIPGWLDTMNSVAALWAAGNMGIIRAVKLPPANCKADFVPVDTVVKATILSAWIRSTGQRLQEVANTDVVNVAIGDVHPVSLEMMNKIFITKARRAIPYASAIRYPVIFLIRSSVMFSIMHFTQHILFGILMDTLLILSKRKPRLLAVYRKITCILQAVEAFLEEFRFDTKHFWRLQMFMHPDDIKDFDLNLDALDPRRDSINQMLGLLEFAFKEKFDREKGLRRIDRLFWVEVVIYVVLGACAVYFFGPSILTVFSSLSSKIMVQSHNLSQNAAKGVQDDEG